MSGGRNTDQIDFWNNRGGHQWVAGQERMDALFAGMSETAIEAAAVKTGERVVDVGCGCGATVIALAHRVGPSGSVVGVDISRPMLDRAGERLREHGLSHATLIQADAAAHAFPPASADLVFSRFGVMFFDDPAPAFDNIRTVLVPGGRLAFLCWQALANNPFFTIPTNAARPHIPPQPPVDPDAPGPFAFADVERLRRILEAAGFTAIRIAPHEAALRLGAPDESEQVARRALEMGPAARMLGEADESVREKVRADVARAMAEFIRPEGIIVPARVWLVAAEA